MGCHPAILMVPKGTEPEDSYPRPDAVTDVVTAALSDAGWTETNTHVVDVREKVIAFQDEVPPKPPVDIPGVVVALGQEPVTSPHGYRGPFQIVLDALADEYGERMELAVDAVSL